MNAAPTRLRSHQWLLLGAALLAIIVIAGLGYWTARSNRTGCAPELVASSELRSPFDQGPPFADTAVQRLSVSLAPIGPTVAGVGYDYDRWLNLAALEHDLVAWTRYNPTWTMLDGQTLNPRWAARSPRSGMTWTASSDRFFAITGGARIRVSSMRISNGHPEWCRELPGAGSARDVATAVTADSGILISTPLGSNSTLTRLSSRAGRVIWSTRLTTPAASVVPIGKHTLVVGGQNYSTAFDPAQISTNNRPRLQGINNVNGHRLWTWQAASAGTIQVLGTTSTEVAVAVVSPHRIRVLLIDQYGAERSLFDLPAQDLQATVRGNLLVTRETQPRHRLVGHDLATGAIRWKLPIARNPQFFPYGYNLAGAPALGSRHLLLGATDALVVLDLQTGRTQRHPLPTDGINTTFWPYQLALIGDGELLGVVTNTAAVVTRGQPRA